MKSSGQYFTPKILAEYMVGQLTHPPTSSSVLEPSAGTGVFLQVLEERGFGRVTAVELDPTLPNDSSTPVRNMDFFDLEVGTNKVDVVVGNPPYVRWKHQSKDKRKELLERTFWGKRMNGLTDLMQPFLFKAVDHLRPGGELVFVTPRFWLQTQHSAPLRAHLLSQGQLTHLIDFNERQVFPNANLNVVVFRFVRGSPGELSPVQVVRFLDQAKGRLAGEDVRHLTSLTARVGREWPEEPLVEGLLEGFVAPHPTTDLPWTFVPLPDQRRLNQLEHSCWTSYPLPCTGQRGSSHMLHPTALWTKEDLGADGRTKTGLAKVSLGSKPYWAALNDPSPHRFVRLGDLAEVANGLVSGLDKAFQLPPELGSELTEAEWGHVVEVVKARDMTQYYARQTREYIFVGPDDYSSEEEFRQACPSLHQHLGSYRSQLERRWTPKPLPWWTWAFPRSLSLFQNHDDLIFVPCKDRYDGRMHVRFAYHPGPYWATQDVTAIAVQPWVRESPAYLVAYLCSEVVFHWLRHKGLRRGGVLEFSERPLNRLPVRLVDWGDTTEVAAHDRIVRHVRQVLEDRTPGSLATHKAEVEELLSSQLLS